MQRSAKDDRNRCSVLVVQNWFFFDGFLWFNWDKKMALIIFIGCRNNVSRANLCIYNLLKLCWCTSHRHHQHIWFAPTLIKQWHTTRATFVELNRRPRPLFKRVFVCVRCAYFFAQHLLYFHFLCSRTARAKWVNFPFENEYNSQEPRWKNNKVYRNFFCGLAW